MVTVEEIQKMMVDRQSFDLFPASGSSMNDMNAAYFKFTYLQVAVDENTLRKNGKTTKEQLAALRFFDTTADCPTNGGILLFGMSPTFKIPGAYIQYVKFNGDAMTTDVEFEKVFSGSLISELKVVDDFIKNNIIKQRPVKTDSFREQVLINYPYWALRELVMNAIMHRSYESNAPIYIYEFTDRIEIINPGGLFGDVNAQNFPNASDYRNIVIAEAMKRLGYVNRFNYGVKRAIDELMKNGNGQPDFDLNLTTKFKVTIPINMQWWLKAIDILSPGVSMLP